MRFQIALSTLALSISSVCLADPTSTLDVPPNTPPMKGGFYACHHTDNKNIRLYVDFNMNTINWVAPSQDPERPYTLFKFSTETLDSFPGKKNGTFMVNAVGTLSEIGTTKVMNPAPNDKIQFMAGSAHHPSDGPTTNTGVIVDFLWPERPWNVWHAYYSFRVGSKIEHGNLTCLSAQNK